MYSSRNLTQRQAQILDFLRNFKNQEGFAPTYREISGHFGFKSTKAASDHVRALEKKGYVRLHGKRSRSIEIVSSEPNSTGHVVSIPILGEIPAGKPEKKEGNRSDTIAVDETIIDNYKGQRLFALKITGESMMGRSICDGDWVIVDADASPNEGEVVVALIDGDNTLKTLAKKKKRFYLKSENPDYLDWIPMEEMIVQGVVKALIRRI
ncbi:MAG: repressor LexA [Desulfobacterales bacterium]|nr:repressor LexA [Desulfobacterales bacterium]